MASLEPVCSTHFIRNIIQDDLKSGKHQEIITRFPPEPNGYLHIGHAKSIFLNFGLVQEFPGCCFMRFDDTNPINENEEYVQAILEDKRAIDNVAQEIQQNVDTQEARRVYDSPSKGVLWGWEVPAYVWTKAIATGTFLMMAVWHYFNGGMDVSSEMAGLIITLIFMGLTGGLLVKDIDRPDRFLYVLLRPQWKSWLVRGAYIITGFGGLVSLKLLDNYFKLGFDWLWIPGVIFAGLGAIYTAFLFNQARARDLWQTPIQSAIHMLVHAVMAGSVIMMIIAPDSSQWMVNILFWGIVANMIIIAKEILLPHDTPDTKKAIELMTKGYYSKYFWVGIVVGSLLPIAILNTVPGFSIIAGGLALVGIYLTEFVRIRVPQMIPLS